MSEKYQTFARKYRPQSFKEVEGQEAIVTTLKNALKLGRDSHAYLFSGLRGVGKTTLARLFAKALNCKNLNEDFEPCNQCLSCQEIASSCSLDVIEIDGASNRGIDDIRQINESISYAPTSGRFKIYIIDEVHMLTKEAFNALLKTLEEPPATIKFFFATTEPHKVLPTIISRCQRFALQPIANDKIVGKLKAIAADIGKEVEEEALRLIAHYAEGSLRDAESLLDQISCFAENTIDQNTVYQILGFLPQDAFFSLDKAFFEGNIAFVFDFVDMFFKSGKNISYFIDELIEHYRYLLMIKLGKEKDELSHFSEQHQNNFLEAAKYYTNEQCIYILDFLMHSISNLQKSISQKVTLEMILLQIIRSKHRIALSTLVHRLSHIEKNFLENPKQTTNLPLEEENKKKTKPLELEKVSFDLTPQKTNKQIPTNMKKFHYDTLMRFASVELNGMIQIEKE